MERARVGKGGFYLLGRVRRKTDVTMHLSPARIFFSYTLQQNHGKILLTAAVSLILLMALCLKYLVDADNERRWKKKGRRCEIVLQPVTSCAETCVII